jgi:hypothetical protein
VLVRTSLVTAAAAALAIVPLTAANAQTWRHTDATGDVQSVAGDADTPTPAPDAVDPDATSVRVSHGPRKVTVRTQFQDLAKASDSFYAFLLQVRTNERVHRQLEVDAGPGMWHGQVTFSSPRKVLHCRGLARSIDYTANTVTVTIPRSCLSNPRWVQVGDAAVKFTGLDATDVTAGTGYVDDAGSPDVGNNIAWSPRIHRG